MSEPMASGSPQLEDGFTRFANELLEAFARTRLAGQEYQVVLAVARLTYGFQGKKADRISYGQLQRVTGISRKKVAQLVSALASKRVLTVSKNGDRKPLTIGINKYYWGWRPIPKKGDIPDKGDSSIPQNGDKANPEKGDYQRKKNNKEIPPAIFEFSEKFHQHQRAQFPTLVRNLTEKKIREGAEAVMRLVKQGHDLATVIRPALKWAVNEPFWSAQVLSLSGLARTSKNGETKFINLLAQYQASTNGDSQKPPRSIESELPL